MVRSNTALLAKALFAETIGSFLYFPIWWYSVGLIRTGLFCLGLSVETARTFAIGVWLRNLFVPMYGQRDFTGRAVSIVMRLVTIIFYAIVLVVVTALALLLFTAWLLLPVFIVLGIVVHMTALL